MTQVPSKHCSLSWHVTSKCNLACRHCLRRTPGQPDTDLTHEEGMQMLDSFFDFVRQSGREASVQLSGGDPLQRDDFAAILQRFSQAKRGGLLGHISILGNPHRLDDTLLGILRQSQVDEFVLSLDGLEAENDYIRGKGCYQETLRGLDQLREAGVPVSIKHTLLRMNAHQTPELLLLGREYRVRIGIGTLILSGGGYRLRDQRLTPQEYRKWLIDMLNFLDRNRRELEDTRRAFITNQTMYARLFHELGRHDEYCDLRQNRQGPQLGSRSNVLFVVWSDGEVVIRREMQRIGRVPENSFQEIYDHSAPLHILEDSEYVRAEGKRQQQQFVKCATCPVSDHCSPRMISAFSNELYFAPAANCWA